MLKEALADRYRFDREIGRGGWGVVYLADDLKLGNQVAVKVIIAGEESLSSRRKFRQEAELEARLGHTNIVPVFDIGEVGDAMYFVMRYVEGGSLEDRIRDTGVLPIREAIQIARQVAAALAHAHANGVVHCDIKPGNILLGPGGAQVADFGIAKHFGPPRSDGRVRTDSTVGAGTVAYMPPEQIDRSLAGRMDGRSDIYALGCVLFEMLTGRLPFRTTSPAEMIEMHARAIRPVASDHRDDVPQSLDELVMQMMAVPLEERPASAQEVIEALDAVALEVEVVRSKELPGPKRKSRALVVAIALVMVALVGAWIGSGPGGGGGDPDALDTTLIVLFPFEGDSATAVDAELRMRNAIQHWDDVRLQDRFSTLEATGSGHHTSRRLARMARAAGAGRFIRTYVTQTPTGLSLRATLVEATSNPVVLIEALQRTDHSPTPPDSFFSDLADRLLVRDPLPRDFHLRRSSTHSLAAVQRYIRGRAFIDAWNLDSAEEALADAARRDEHFAEAAQWLALTRFWLLQPSSAWRLSALAASRDTSTSDRRAASHGRALLLFADGDTVAACLRWEGMTRQFPYDFSAWFSAAVCRDRDRRVEPDRASPSGYRFRSSYHSAQLHYLQAFDLHPSILRALRDDAFARVRALLQLDGNAMRPGYLAPSGEMMVASARIRDDTLVLVPYPMSAVTGASSEAARAHHDSAARAVRRQRQVFRNLTTMWVSREPTQPEAHEARALAAQLLGDNEALTHMSRAVQLSRDDVQRRQMQGSESWIRLRFALPDDPASLVRARALADSALRGDVSGPDVRARMSLAALTCQPERALALTGPLAAIDHSRLPTALHDSIQRYNLRASFGLSAQDARTQTRTLDSLMVVTLDSTLLPAARQRAFQRAASFAWPDATLDTTLMRRFAGDYLTRALLADIRADSTAVATEIAALLALRAIVQPSDASIDALVVEATFMRRHGKAALAIRWLDEALLTQRTDPPEFDPVKAIALVRAMILRAELADDVGDHETRRRWARAVTALCAGLDGLSPALRRRVVEFSR